MSTERDLMRIVIVGHVDHGKSTLVGRLFHDTGSLPDGKLEQHQGDVRAARHAVRMGVPDGCLPVRARPGHHHRHVADLASSTPKRDYVIIDAPGHSEFIKNMITGAASAEAALIADRRQRGHRAAIAHATPSCCTCSASARSSWWSTRWIWWAAARRPSRRSRRSMSRYLDELGIVAELRHPGRRRATATTWAALGAHGLVQRCRR